MPNTDLLLAHNVALIHMQDDLCSTHQNNYI